MNPSSFHRETSCRNADAFTLVEIAISLAVIAYALVAIIGVLPRGMKVQQDNREETIINQDATVLANAMRGGIPTNAVREAILTGAYDELTNAVTMIEIHWQEFKVTPGLTNTGASGTDRYTYTESTDSLYTAVPKDSFGITNGTRIIGLLSTPKYLPEDVAHATAFFSNHVVAYVRAFSGPSTEKFPQDNRDVRQDAFSYRLICENQLLPTPDYELNSTYRKNLTSNLRELRLNFRWPLLASGRVPDGGSRQIFRFQVGGQLGATADPFVPTRPLWFFQPTAFAQAKP